MQTKYQTIEEWRAAQALRQRVWRRRVKERLTRRPVLPVIKEVKGGRLQEVEVG